ncbi:JASMONATE-ASSOCIATED 1, TIFY DOMAIN PROTEIN 9, jasmonate-zim-domain protein 10 [Hibiscus trionum]|uniref:Protein TIFY n=1 Tax=Hibiscus trionum TaxID=183268 RepID=A0A9W7HC52_HIBTR|nr:JASMONATE-ASSOCIATED 1, TIFY DOMAIN PROTEIN 9, jasmonate-zim-domain protein 10 [Hibiscus trionum]
MSRASVELDFFGMEKENSCKSQFQKFLDRRRSFRGLQGAISKMNPELIKSVIASGLTNPVSQDQIDSNKPASVPSSPKETQSLFPDLPLLAPAARAASENGNETAPLTIFYNGTVSVFNVPRDKAESILKHAVEGVSKNVESVDSEAATPSSDQQQLLQNLDGDLPIARRKSLQRFLEKRKERLTCASPYGC